MLCMIKEMVRVGMGEGVVVLGAVIVRGRCPEFGGGVGLVGLGLR